MSKDKGFFDNLLDFFGDDEEEVKDSGSPGDGGSGGAGGSGSAGDSGDSGGLDGAGGASGSDEPLGNDGAHGASSDDGSGEREDLPIEEGEEEGFGIRTTEEDDSDGTAGAENLGKSGVGLGVLLDTLGATDIALWPHSIIQLIDVAIHGDGPLPTTPALGENEYEIRGHYGLADWHKDIEDYGLCRLGWADVTFDAGLDVVGVWKPSANETSLKPSYDRGFAAALEFWAKDSSWTEQAGEIQWGTPKHNDESHGEDSVALALQYKHKLIFRKGSELEMPVELIAVFNAIEFERPKGSTIWYRASVAKIEVTVLAGATAVTFDTPHGRFKGTISIYGEAEIEPDYEKLLNLAINKWGKDLAVDLGSLLTLPVVVFVAGLVNIAWGVRELLDAWSMEDLRVRIVPECTSAGTQGYMEGLRGTNEGDPGASASDPDTARDAYAALGYKRRLELITSKCNNDADAFTRWVNEHSAEIESQTRSQLTVLVKKRLFAAKAADYAAGFMVTPGEALSNQKYAWTAIIGNSPKSMGGEWLTLWLQHRTYATGFEERSAGDW